MIRAHLTRALLVSAAMLLASTASAEPAGPQGKSHGSDDGKKAGAKPDEKADKKGDDKKGDDKKGDDKGKSGEHASRVAKQHEDQKAKLQSMLKGPMDAPVKEELRRHAERVARIERIKVVATEAKDTDATDRAGKLLGKENARHDKWMEKHVAPAAAAAPATPAAATATGAAPAAPAPAAKGDVK
jgi:hypothetical protein